jgi:hypothetical protein
MLGERGGDLLRTVRALGLIFLSVAVFAVMRLTVCEPLGWGYQMYHVYVMRCE